VRDVSAWLKTFRSGNPLSPRKYPDDRPGIGGVSTFYEPLRRRPDGSPKLTRQGEPEGRPGWRPGELIAGYWNGTYRVGEVWEVVSDPVLCELDNWGWQTTVRLLQVREPGASLDELGIRTMSLARATRLRLGPDQERRLRALVSGS
jgi:hypothetical protein